MSIAPGCGLFRSLAAFAGGRVHLLTGSSVDRSSHGQTRERHHANFSDCGARGWGVRFRRCQTQRDVLQAPSEREGERGNRRGVEEYRMECAGEGS